VSRVCWKPILKQAALTMQSYDTGVTLRQLFYRLVAKVILPKHSDLLPATEQVRPWRLEDLYRRRPTSSRQRRKGAGCICPSARSGICGRSSSYSLGSGEYRLEDELLALGRRSI
jgi:hypothetical protein